MIGQYEDRENSYAITYRSLEEAKLGLAEHGVAIHSNGGCYDPAATEALKNDPRAAGLQSEPWYSQVVWAGRLHKLEDGRYRWVASK